MSPCSGALCIPQQESYWFLFCRLLQNNSNDISKGLRPTPPPRIGSASLWNELSSAAPAACFSVILFERFFWFVLFSLQTDCRNCSRILLKSCKKGLGSHLRAPWGAPGAQNASRSEKNNIKLNFIHPPSGDHFFGHFRQEIWKRTICFFFSFWGRHLDAMSLISA